MLVYCQELPTVEELVHLFEAVKLWSSKAQVSELEKALKNSSVCLTARDDVGQLVGFCRSITDHQCFCVIAALAVRPDHQKQGIGKALLEKTIALSDGAQRTQVLLMSEPGALDFYQKLGFSAKPHVLSR